MPSPFPGMDPYLERPDVFGTLHDNMITYIIESLQPRLPAPYFADTGRRVWVEMSHRMIEPDVNVRRVAENGGDDAGGALAVATATLVCAEPVVVTVPHDEHREPFVQIMAQTEEGERLVTLIEVLSPTNKTPGSKGRDLYVRKQQEILDSPIHLVEIDLLRGGEHTTAVPRAFALRKTGPFDYHVCVHRSEHFEDYLVYPIALPMRLPTVGIPLLAGDPDVPLDLQAVFDRCYEIGPYRRRIRYDREEPVPPLSPAQGEWAKSCLAPGERPA